MAETPTKSPVKESALIASPETRQFLGVGTDRDLGTFMAKRAGTDYLMFVADEDFRTPFQASEQSSSMIQEANRSLADDEKRSELYRKAGNNLKSQEQTDYYMQQFGQHLPLSLQQQIAKFSREQRGGLGTAFSSLIQNQGREPVETSPADASFFRLPNGETLGIVRINRQVINNLSADMKVDLQNTQNTQSRYSDKGAYVLLHEVGHIHQLVRGKVPHMSPQVTTLESAYQRDLNQKSDLFSPVQRKAMETYADQFSLREYSVASHEGLVDNPDIRREVITGRLKASLRVSERFRNYQNGDSHDTAQHLLLSNPERNLGGAPLSPGHDRSFQDFLRRLNTGIGDTLLARDNSVNRAASFAGLNMTGVENCRRDVAKVFDSRSLKEKFGECVRVNEVAEPVIVGVAQEISRQEKPGTPGRIFADIIVEGPSAVPDRPPAPLPGAPKTR